ncbi:MAG: hypothetical protein HQK51_20455 [Oligoflexia bacterium]|nr:hypothetical protein [Oligoflexia bacterium]
MNNNNNNNNNNSNIVLLLDSKFKESDVGPKFYKQKLMYNLSINVPKFFCINTCLYDEIFLASKSEILDHLNSINWNDSKSIKNKSIAIANIFRKFKFSTQTITEILGCMNKYFAKDSFVSVRSSMIGNKIEESEDSSIHSFAGMSESFLYVRQEQVIEKIKECFASGFSEQVMLYRYKQNLDPIAFKVSV